MGYKLPISSVEQKNLIASTSAYIVCLEVDVKNPLTGAVVETLYLARNEEDIDVEGVTYVAAAFNIDLKYEGGGQPVVTVTAEDITGAIQARMQQFGGGVGFIVRVIVANMESANGVIDTIETFEIVDAGAADYQVSWTLGTENMLGHQFPNRRQLRDRCTWRYKSAECGYKGSKTSCDYTLKGPNGCSSHANTINYGGFPGIRGNGMRYV